MNTATFELNKLFVHHKLTTKGKQFIGLYVERNLTETGNELAEQYAQLRNAQDTMRRDFYEVKLGKEISRKQEAYQPIP